MPVTSAEGRGKAAPRRWMAMDIGTTARRTRTVTTEDIDRFAAMTGDRNPIHFDAELAAATRFGGIVVQGGVTSGLLNAVVAEDVPGPGSVFLETNWRFLKAVRPGDTITAEVEVLEARQDKPVTRLRTTITDQHGDVVLDGTAVVYTVDLAAAADAVGAASTTSSTSSTGTTR
jgi:acyl dehydratase